MLFAQYRAAADYAAADRAELEAVIRPTGYYRAKADTLIRIGQAPCDRFGGKVPDTLDDLLTLPGVGRKTANMALGDAVGKPALVVDTHVARLARRIRWTVQTGPDKIEHAVAALLPPREWTAATHRLIWHGRRVCPRADSRVRRLRDRPAVLVLRRRASRRSDCAQARQDRAIFLTGVAAAPEH